MYVVYFPDLCSVSHVSMYNIWNCGFCFMTCVYVCSGLSVWSCGLQLVLVNAPALTVEVHPAMLRAVEVCLTSF